MRTQQQLTRTWKQPVESVSLSQRVRQYIDLCDAISKSSHDVLYRSLRWLNHLEQLKRTLYPMLLPSSAFSLKDIAQFTMMVRIHLQGILPLSTHSSYKECNDILDKILDDCMLLSKKTSSSI